MRVHIFKLIFGELCIVEYEGRNLGECFEMVSGVIENSTNSFRTLLLLMQMFKSQLWLFIEKKKKLFTFAEIELNL
jgi:hypothetical protein